MGRYLLRYFLAVAEIGNFSRAAQRVNVAQPTLSAGIAKLESQFGAKLFHRTNRRVSLTDAGSRFLLRARRIEQEFNLAVEELSDSTGSKLIRIGAGSTFGAVRGVAATPSERNRPSGIGGPIPSLELLIKVAGPDAVCFGTERIGSGTQINPDTGRSYDDIKPEIEAIVSDR